MPPRAGAGKRAPANTRAKPAQVVEQNTPDDTTNAGLLQFFKDSKPDIINVDDNQEEATCCAAGAQPELASAVPASASNHDGVDDSTTQPSQKEDDEIDATQATPSVTSSTPTIDKKAIAQAAHDSLSWVERVGTSAEQSGDLESAAADVEKALASPLSRGKPPPQDKKPKAAGRDAKKKTN